MPLQGTFDVLDFIELLQLLSSQQMTGRVHVRSRAYGAYLFVEDGLLVGADQSEHQPAATAGDVRGRLEEVCFEMLEAERGSFEFHPGKPSSLPVGERFKADEVLAQARKRLEEWHQLQEVIPSLDLQPRLVLDLSATEITLDRERWRMLAAVDGRRNLRAIGRVLNLSDFDVCRVMATLVEDGMVELDGIGALPASTRDAMPVVPAPGADRPSATTDVTRAVVISRPGPAEAGEDGWAPSDSAPLAEPAPGLAPPSPPSDRPAQLAPVGGEDDETVALPVVEIVTDPGIATIAIDAGENPPEGTTVESTAAGDGEAGASEVNQAGWRGRRIIRIHSKGDS
jgi:hypothetical protein